MDAETTQREGPELVVVRRSGQGWQVGPEQLADLTSAMVLADLLALTSKGEAAFERAHTVFLRSLERNFGRRLQPGEAEAVSAALSRLP